MSEAHQQRSFKFHRLREALRGAIAAGELRHKLPGERELARRFGVNAKTISKALSALCAEGVVVRQVGRGTFVTGRDADVSPPGGARQYLWLASTAVAAAGMDGAWLGIQQRLAGQGHRLLRHVVDADDHGELAPRCVPAGRLKEVAGVVVFSSQPHRALLAELLHRRLAVILFNAGSRTIKVDTVVPDYAHGVFELTDHLLYLGHRRIQLVVDRQLIFAGAQMQRGYQTAMGRLSCTPLPMLPCLADDVGPLLALNPQPTAVVCVGGRLAVNVRAVLQQRRRLIPQQFSLVAMASPGQILTADQRITSYDVHPDHLVDWAVTLLDDHAPGTVPRTVVVPGVFTDRGSALSSDPRRIESPAHAVIL